MYEYEYFDTFVTTKFPLTDLNDSLVKIANLIFRICIMLSNQNFDITSVQCLCGNLIIHIAQVQLFFNIELENQVRENFYGYNRFELLLKTLISGRNYLGTAQELYYQVWMMDRKIPVLLLQSKQLIHCVLEAGKFFNLKNLTYKAMQRDVNFIMFERFLFIKRYPHLAQEVTSRSVTEIYYALPDQCAYTDMIVKKHNIKNTDLFTLREHVRLLTETIADMHSEQNKKYSDIAKEFATILNTKQNFWSQDKLKISMMIQPLLDILRPGNFAMQWNKTFSYPHTFKITGEKFINKEDFNEQWIEIEQ